MSIIDQKKDIFGSIGALNALSDNYPKLPKFNSLPSINNGSNSTSFLIDLVTTLAGFSVLKDHVVDTITYKLPQLEDSVKDALKRELKEIVSCNVNPSIPSWFQNGGPGVIMKVTDIDFYDSMKVNPDTTAGSLIYTDIDSGVNSRDFNTYLYNTIQDPNAPKDWGASTISTDLLETTFLETSATNNNVLKFNTSTGFSNKKLTEFNNAYVDSITLFGEPNSSDSKTMTNMLMEELFGSVSSSSSVNKSKKQLKREAEVREVLDCIINSENNVIDDSFFTFDNPTLAKMEEEVNNRKNGIRKIKTCGDIAVKISDEDLKTNQDIIEDATTKEEEFEAVSQALDNLSNIQSGVAPNEQDRQTVNNDFFINIINKFTNTTMNLILTPKFITIFAINHQIIYGEGVSYDGPVDFMQKNKKIVKNMSNQISNVLIGLLLTLALKHLTIKLRDKLIGDEIEKNKNYLAIILSYVGVPPSVISQITNT